MATVSKSIKKYSNFEPRYINDCTLWLDGMDTSSNSMTLSGSSILTWKDKSSSGNNATGATNKPITLTVGSRNLVVFSAASSQYMTLDVTKLPVATSSFTVFCVSNPTTQTATEMPVLTWGSFTSGNGFRYYFTGANPTICNSTFQFMGTSTEVKDTTNVRNSFPIFSATSTTTLQTGYRNGTSFGTTSSSYNIGTNVAYIGTYNAISTFYEGAIGEIIVYNRALSTTERQQVEGYLGGKWGLSSSLAIGHPYISRNPVLSTFVLTDISGCSVWLDGYDPSNNNTRPSNGSTVSIWYDKSGNGNNAIQYLTNGVPTYNLTSRALSFNNQMYALTNAISQIGTLFIVGKQTSSNGTIMSAKDTSSYSPYYISIKNDTSVTLSKTDSSLVNFQSLPSSFNTITLISGVVTSTDVSAILNGGSTTVSQSYTGTLKTATQTYISASWYNSSVSISAASEINEIILFNTALTTSQRQTIEGYLAYKWGLQPSLPSNHIYKNFPPLKIN